MMSGFLDTMYGNMMMQMWLQSQIANGITWCNMPPHLLAYLEMP